MSTSSNCTRIHLKTPIYSRDSDQQLKGTIPNPLPNQSSKNSNIPLHIFTSRV